MHGNLSFCRSKAIFSNQKSLAFEDLIEPIFGHPKQVGKMGISAHSHFGYILRALIILTSIHSFVCKFRIRKLHQRA